MLKDMAVAEHKRHARKSLAVGVLTTSDSRTPENDTGGHLIRQTLVAAGHQVPWYRIVPDDAKAIREALDDAIEVADAVIITGGTGIAPRDVTADVVRAMLEKELPGFGEIFRSLSYAEIGSAALMSRAIAGVYHGKFIAALPGSPAGCRLAMEKLVIPELGHIAWLLNPDPR